jgi:hypothetical protein
VARVQAQQAAAGRSKDQIAKEKERLDFYTYNSLLHSSNCLIFRELRAKEKAEEEKRRKEEAALLRPVQAQKVPFGVDPKTILCAYFKVGTCDKGSRCKFSHDMNVGRKVVKKNIYEDSREEKLKGAQSFCSKHVAFGEYETSQIPWILGTLKNYRRSCYPRRGIHGRRQMYDCVHSQRYLSLIDQCQIVCKHFISAIENQKYAISLTLPKTLHLMSTQDTAGSGNVPTVINAIIAMPFHLDSCSSLKRRLPRRRSRPTPSALRNS